MEFHPKLLVIPILVALLMGCQPVDKNPPVPEALLTSAYQTADALRAQRLGQESTKPASDSESEWESQQAEYEGVRVAVTYPKTMASLADLRLQITRHGLVVYDDKVAPDVFLGRERNFSLSSVDAPEFYNLDADAEAEIVLKIRESGSDCCAWTLIGDYDPVGSQYSFTWNNWGPYRNMPKFDDPNADGKVELISHNENFSSNFGPYAVSGAAPIQVWDYTTDGLQEATIAFPELILQDADYWLRSYSDEGSDWFGLPVALSAYIADRCLLGTALEGTPGEGEIDWDQVLKIFYKDTFSFTPPGESWHAYRIDLDRNLSEYGYDCKNTLQPHQIISSCGLGCHEVLPAPQIDFSYDPLLATGVISETTFPDLDFVPSLQDPEHYLFTFDGYQHVDYGDELRWNRSQISIYPVDGTSVSNTAADLRVLLNQRPATASGALPCLGMRGAAQIIQAGVSYLDFQNGSGMRYVTWYAQAAYPISNPGLFYTFQGLTNDGRYYISATFSVSNPVLDEGIVVWDQVSLWQDYIEDIEALLSAQPPQSFTPDLSLLDAMMRSIYIE
jgi:hypothetical protein